jgi:hypothetical protein
MELVKFSNHLGGKDPTQPPFRIPAKDLDSNFAKLRPLPTDGNARQYAVEETPEGWFLRLFPDAPSANVALLNGLQLVEVERCDGKKMKVLGTGWYDS